HVHAKSRATRILLTQGPGLQVPKACKWNPLQRLGLGHWGNRICYREKRKSDEGKMAENRADVQAQAYSVDNPSRRDLLRTGTVIAASAGAVQLLAGEAAAQDAGGNTLEQLTRANRDPARRILLKGGTIITMDPVVGDFVRADLLIEGKKISA